MKGARVAAAADEEVSPQQGRGGKLAWSEPQPQKQQQQLQTSSSSPQLRKSGAELKKGSTLKRMLQSSLSLKPLEGLSCRWEHASNGTTIGDGGRSVRCFKEPADDKSAACVASALPSSGIVDFSITVLKSDVIGMLVGVVENRERYGSFATWPKAWALATWNGRLVALADARQRHGGSFGPAVMRGDLRGNASGKSIQMRVDMDRRKLYYKVNTLDWMCASDADGRPIQLSANVSPFVRFSHVGDAVALGAVSQANTMAPSGARNLLGGCAECDMRKRHTEELQSEVETLRSELEKMKLLLHAEAQARRTAEYQRDQAMRRAEQLKRMAMRPDAAQRIEQAARARDLKETLVPRRRRARTADRLPCC